MGYSIRRDVLHATGVVLTAGIAAFAAAGVVTTSEPAFAASQDYRFELLNVAPVGPGRTDVIIRLVRATDGKPVVDADITANAAVATPVGQPGHRQFRIATATPGPQTLQVSAKVPGTTRIERTFNSSVKWWQERRVRSQDRVVNGVVSFDAR